MNHRTRRRCARADGASSRLVVYHPPSLQRLQFTYDKNLNSRHARIAGRTLHSRGAQAGLAFAQCRAYAELERRRPTSARILETQRLEVQKERKWNPTCVPINIIYQGITSGSPARRLLIDIHASDAREYWYPEDVHVDPVFLMDLVRRFLGCFKTNEGLPKNNRFEIAAEDYTI